MAAAAVLKTMDRASKQLGFCLRSLKAAKADAKHLKDLAGAVNAVRVATMTFATLGMDIDEHKMVLPASSVVTLDLAAALGSQTSDTPSRTRVSTAESQHLGREALLQAERRPLLQEALFQAGRKRLGREALLQAERGPLQQEESLQAERKRLGREALLHAECGPLQQEALLQDAGLYCQKRYSKQNAGLYSWKRYSKQNAGLYYKKRFPQQVANLQVEKHY
eukprot:TRINITY_DN7362_c0_g1_i16.p1 TRINITY_DN7362_c0_g1~~TRINITY_DN7362_c0_g1_i16.p1  ORF type:complete len:222 (-),score=39.04 TRINITY_DN7362_c0_g1_i16:12-677(-)